MDDFPSNSKHPARREKEQTQKRVERVTTSEVVRRKQPVGRRLTKNLVGGDAHGAWGHVFVEILFPAARAMIADTLTGGIERMIFGDRGGGRSRYDRGYTPYNAMSRDRYSREEDDRGRMSRRGRANHSFDEIIIEHRVDAERVLDRMDEFIGRYQVATVADLYGLVGESSSYVDRKWGWRDLRDAQPRRVRHGYLLDLPKPEWLD